MESIVDYIRQARRRRRELARRIGDGAAVLTQYSPRQNNGDAFYSPRRFDGYLYYLSGCVEPSAALLLTAKGGRLRREILFVRRRDRISEQWHGKRLGPLMAKRRLHIDETADVEDFPARLAAIIADHDTVHYIPGADEGLDKLLRDICIRRRADNRGGSSPVGCLRDVSVELDEMRAIKDECELAILRRAIDITAEGHLAAMKRAPTATNECQLDAALTAVYRNHGAYHAFAPIVASGGNGCILHYTDNCAAINRKKLLLVDSGCKWRGYAGDITRVFPASGKFSPPQAEVYDIVLRAQLKAIAAVKPLARWSGVESAAVRALAEGLRALGLCKGGVKMIVGGQKHKRFYMHRAGHFLGLDVHDVGRMTDRAGKSRRLLKNMMVTVEPGLYIPDAADIPKPYRGIGVRIEDDVLVTAAGRQVLSRVPKTRAAIEKWMNE